MPPLRRFCLLAPLACMATPALALAQTTTALPTTARNSVREVWTTVSTTTDLTDRFRLDAEVVVRSEDGFDGVRQLQLRGVVTTEVTDGLRIGLGYVRSENSPRGRPNSFENTPFPQVNWTIGKVLGGELSSRTRMEFRLRPDGRDTSYRLRQLVRFSLPLGPDLPKLRLSEEAFFELAATDGRDNAGYSASRLAAGLQFKLSDNLSIEPGYLAEIVRVRRGSDLTRHVLNLAIATSF